MAKLPDDIMELMQSDAYSDSSDSDHASVSAQVAKYFQDKYGKSTTGATGRNVSVRKYGFGMQNWTTEHARNAKFFQKKFMKTNPIYRNIHTTPIVAVG